MILKPTYWFFAGFYLYAFLMDLEQKQEPK